MSLSRILPNPTQVVQDDDKKRKAFTNKSGEIVPFRYDDLVGQQLPYENADVAPPAEDIVEETTDKTRTALEKLLNSKISAAMPVRKAELPGPAQYIRYTPSQQGLAYNSGAKQRIIRMVDVQKDPMEPPRFNVTKKLPRGPPSPPAPVIHSPTRKVTAKEQQEWKIPPCISNWKNNKGYVIPLDKRMAADGRGLQDVHINENFSKLAEALFIADRKAREAVEKRAQYEKRLAQKEKEKQEDNLRQLARQAREARDMVAGGIGAEDESAKDREEFRQDRRQERQRERNIARAAPDKQAKLRRELDRDISEQIALGRPAPSKPSDDSMFDQRLFNQTKGLDSGFMDDEAYDVYDKPWRADKDMASHIYRPSKNVDQDVYGDDLDKLASTSRFVPDKGFEGAEKGQKREGPVQFEKDDDDPFGLYSFFATVKEGAGGKRTAGKRDEREAGKAPGLSMPSGQRAGAAKSSAAASSSHSSKSDASSRKKPRRD